MTLFIVLMQVVQAVESVVEIIPVYNRPASDLMPVLMPLLEPDDHVVPNGENLIVKTAPERVQMISNLVRKLDSPITNFLISVIQSRDTTATELNARWGAQVNIHGKHSPEFSGGGFVNHYQGEGRNQLTQTVRTSDGQTAYIKAGNTYPVNSYQAYPDPYGFPVVTASTQYHEATTGFAVTPRLNGRQVSLDVLPWSGGLTRQGQFQVQEAETSIRINLGEWVEIGQISESGQNTGGSIYGYNNQASDNRLHILVKVDVVN